MLSRRSWLIVAALASLLLVGHLIGVCGPRFGREFSPDTFRTRSYEAYQWGPVQFPRFEEERESALSRYLVANGHLQSNPRQVRWVHTYNPPMGVLALVICQFGQPSGWVLGELEDRTDELLEWSAREPELANAFWSRIVKWVQEDRYYETFELLHHFYEPKSMEELEARFEEAERNVRGWD